MAMKSIYTFLTVLLCISSFGQNAISIKGRIVDSLNLPLEYVTVYLNRDKDSTMVGYTVTDKTGNFDLKIRSLQEGTFLKASMMSYQDFVKEYPKGITENDDLGKIVLKDLPTNLDELLIVAETPPLRVRNDTIEYNAGSFKVRPDAKLLDLLKQLPGLQIDENKKITVNGKEVNEILVNGKPFFSEDGKVALENLPSEIINKIQVTDKKTKREKFTGERAKSDDASINVTIDEENNKGYFGQVNAGYGTDDRYEAGLFLNSFNKRRKISVIGSANNINAVGFSMDDVFDNMRSGRSRGGVTESRMIGLNYLEDFTELLSGNGSYDYNFSETENRNKTTSTRFLPSGQFYNTSSSSSKSGDEGNKANFSIDYRGEKDFLSIMPNFSKGHTYSNSQSEEASFDENMNPLNESRSQSYSRGDSNNFANNISYVRNFKKPGQFLSVNFSNSNSKGNNEILFESDTKFFQSEKADDMRRQFKNSEDVSDTYSLDVSFRQPITDSLSFEVGTEWNYRQSINSMYVYDYDEATGEYSSINKLETNRYKSVVKETSPFVRFAINKNKFSLYFTSYTDIVKNSADALYNEKDYSLDKYYISPRLNMNTFFNVSKNDNIYFSYGYNQTYQSATELLEITDISNPLHTKVGNPNLKPTDQHNFSFNYRSYDFQTRSGYSIGGNLSLQDNTIVNAIEYDEDMKSISTYKNISGNYQWSARVNLFQNKKVGEHNFRYGIGVRFSNHFSKGYIDNVMYESRANTIVPNAYFSYDYGEFLTLHPSYTYNYNRTSYNNFTVDKASNFTHRFNLEATTYWPKNFIFGNDFNYTYNSQIAQGYKKDFYMWNISLAYEFFDSKFRAKVKVYDVLNQNTSSRRTIDPTEIVDSESLVLKQYVMFSLVYKLNEFGGPKKGKGTKGGRGKRGQSMRAFRM
ncbi:outer membrane beta-barrel protein [Myroides albus]|nr:outer membrane beta-barrel protein [Myroides albus]